MAAVLDWRLPELTTSNPGPLPWLPGIPEALHDHPVWGEYLALRAGLIPSLSPLASRGALLISKAPGLSWLSRALGQASPSSLKSQCGGPPTASIPEHRDQPVEPNSKRFPALWKQRLDRDIARSADSSGNARFDGPQAAHTALSRRHDDRPRPYQTPGRRPKGPAAPGR